MSLTSEVICDGDANDDLGCIEYGSHASMEGAGVGAYSGGAEGSDVEDQT